MARTWTFRRWRPVRVAVLPTLLVGVVALLALTGSGCQSMHNYAVDRGRDALDIVTATAGTGYGISARVGVVHLGACYAKQTAGLAVGELSADRCRQVVIDPLLFLPANVNPPGFVLYVEEMTGWSARGKDYRMWGIAPFLCFPSTNNDWPFRAVWTPAVGQVQITAGICKSLQLGFNVIELVDFAVGLTTLDLCQDDVGVMLSEKALQPVRQESKPTQRPPVVANPNYAGLFLLLGHQSSDAAKAEDLFLRALRAAGTERRMAMERQRALMDLTLLYQKQGRTAEAEKRYGEFLATKPDLAKDEVLGNLSRRYEEERDRKR